MPSGAATDDIVRTGGSTAVARALGRSVNWNLGRFDPDENPNAV